MDWSRFVKLPDSVPSSTGPDIHGREAIDRMTKQLVEGGTEPNRAESISKRCARRRDTGENRPPKK